MAASADALDGFGDSRRAWLRKLGLIGLGLGCCGGQRYSDLLINPQRGTAARALRSLGKAAALTGLGEPDANGIRLPPGFRSRVLARAGETPTPGGTYSWHSAPDGGAVFPQNEGGWLYVSNSEVNSGGGGAGALRFDQRGKLLDAYPILAGTSLNCAGGATPWGTWLSCEEIEQGQVWECDPGGNAPAVARPALGQFRHEAVAVDPVERRLYLTEDTVDGRFYRFTPDIWPNLEAGTLEVAQALGNDPQIERMVVWHRIDAPNGLPTATRYQVGVSTPFNGGEGISLQAGLIYFSTKGDNRVWAYRCADAALSLAYDASWFASPVLTGVDNLIAMPDGRIYVAEDGGDMQIVAISGNETVPVVQVLNQPTSEITGPAFSPDGRFLYFSSQRGPSAGGFEGITYAIEGDFDVYRVFGNGFEG